MSLSEYFLRDSIGELENRVSILENKEQLKQDEHCKHDAGFIQMPNSGSYEKCRKCGMAVYIENLKNNFKL